MGKKRRATHKPTSITTYRTGDQTRSVSHADLPFRICLSYIRHSPTNFSVRWRLPKIARRNVDAIATQLIIEKKDWTGAQSTIFNEDVSADRKKEFRIPDAEVGYSYRANLAVFDAKIGRELGRKSKLFHMVFSHTYLEALYNRAVTWTRSAARGMHQFDVLYHVVSGKIKKRKTLLRKSYTNCGHPLSAANAKELKGIFFASKRQYGTVRVIRNNPKKDNEPNDGINQPPGEHDNEIGMEACRSDYKDIYPLPTRSPYGRNRWKVKAQKLLNPNKVNFYFCDFHCMSSSENNLEKGSPHYVVIVVVEKEKAADRYCRRYMRPLNPETNPFLQIRKKEGGGGYDFYEPVASDIWLSVLYCSRKVQKSWGVFDKVNILGTGKSRGGHNTLCTVCNNLRLRK